MLTVLVIDDDSTILLLLKAYLDSVGFHCLTASDGTAGLETFVDQNPDVVLCDLSMPGMDGLAVLAEVRRTSPLTPFVVFSGTSDVRRAVEALKRGAWDYLLKPLPDLELLPPLLSRLEERAQLLREKERYQTRLEAEVKERTAQLVEKLREKDLLLAEVHHRVRNNLQIVQTILGLEWDQTQGTEREALGAAQARLQVLALVQDQLYDRDRAPLVRAEDWFPGLVNHLLSAHGLTAGLDLVIDVEERVLAPGQAIVCGLVLYEVLGSLSPGLRLRVWLRGRVEGGVEVGLEASKPFAVPPLARDLAVHHGGSLEAEGGVVRLTLV